MVAPLTVDGLVDQVRDQLDETNVEVVSQSDILQALNRGQRHATNITAKHFEELLLEIIEFSSTDAPFATSEPNTFNMPEDAFGNRLEHLLVQQGGYDYPLRREDFRQIQRYTSTARVNIPSIYALIGRGQYIVRPTPSQGINFKMYYIRQPETLVTSQGRITSLDGAGTFLKVDSLGSDLSTSVDDLSAFVNIVDAQTGRVKSSHQIASIDTGDKQINIKTATPDRSVVYGKTIATAIPTTGDFTPELDDYVCAVTGTAVCEYPDAYRDFLIQYATYEIRRRLGEQVQDEKIMFEELREEVERMWVGREQHLKIARRNKHWLRG